MHVMQRGHDRQPAFVESADYEYYLENIREAKLKFEVDVHAYCLMTNHVHLLITPGQDATNVSLFVRMLAARQTRRVNRLEGRTGTLWEGRFKASLVDSDCYLLACHRYIELNPVRAGIVNTPVEYRWSSVRHHCGVDTNEWLTPSTAYLDLGASKIERSERYRRFIANGTDAMELDHFRQAIQRNQVTGNRKFEDAIEARIGRRIHRRGPGRPPREK
ncbi:MAG TPA: transposase [Woeseiaceae bacterium]|nr:transposase [Woeseiaceae bacterium]